MTTTFTPAAKAKQTRIRKSNSMTRHLLEIERALGRRITPAELRSELFRASRDVFVSLVIAERKSDE